VQHELVMDLVFELQKALPSRSHSRFYRSATPNQIKPVRAKQRSLKPAATNSCARKCDLAGSSRRTS